MIPSPTLVVLAAGLSSRYGAAKQLDPIGSNGETLIDYSAYDASRVGYRKVVLVIRPELETLFLPVVERLAAFLPTELAFQRIDQVSLAPGGRTRPWGTGHALLAAESCVDGPFALINGDDFYGDAALALACGFLTSTRPTAAPSFALVGYVLHNTLWTTGGVSRAVCTSDDSGFLKAIREVRDVRRDERGIDGTLESGETASLTGQETVSTNLWALDSEIFPLFRRHFAEFLSAPGTHSDTEFLIGSAVNAIVAQDQASFKMLPTDEPCLGVTHAEDKPIVQARIRTLIEAGRYPVNLFKP